MSDPLTEVTGLTDTENVSKAQFVSYEKNNLYWFTNCAAVRNRDLSGRSRIMVGTRLFKKDTGDISADNGTEDTPVIIDFAGNHWVLISSVGIAIDAHGVFADRSDFDDEAAEFVYLSTDGDGGSITDAVLFIKNTATSADWSDAIPIRGERGGDRWEIGNWDSDRPASGEELLSWIATTTVTLPAGLPASQAKARVASTGTAIYSIRKNDVQVGTITFTASASGVFAMASQQTFNQGDRLSIVAPNPRDATLSGVVTTLVGTAA